METSDERREVAANLRRLDDGAIALIDERMNRLTNEMLARSAVLNIGLSMAMCAAGLETETLGGFWDLLADLIDPTCEWRNDGGNQTPWRCAACGCERSAVPNYCPNCGARVVSGDE